MKDIYVIMAFHAHELLWDLPEKLLSYLDDGNPMKETILDQNYIKKRKEEDRDVYTLGIQLGEKLHAPICVEYTNELLQQINEVIPEIFHKIKGHFHSGRLYPIYGHAHHTHVSLLSNEEITQEITWNMQLLHNFMDVPYPKYKGFFSPEASYSFDKIEGAAAANIDYLIFPHLSEDKAPFEIVGKGDYIYKPFLIKAGRRNILALPRNFPISQEIWRPITRMKRDAVKDQGYRLGDYAVFFNEYLSGQTESYPIEMSEGVELYKAVLRQELTQAPPDALLVYIQDLELMDFGDIAIEILGQAWQEVLQEDREKYRVHFVTPDQYIDQVLIAEGVEKLPVLRFENISWAPEIRLVLRADGHYPPLGVTGVGRYSTAKSGMYEHPHIFWENGKYFCGLFDTLVENFDIKVNIAAHGERFNETAYELAGEDLDTRVIMYRRLMKRACNWGWRPTEGRQKRPCLDGYLLCDTLLKKIEQFPGALIFSREPVNLEPRQIVGLVETLQVFIDRRLEYLRYGMEKYMAEHGGDLSEAYREIETVNRWKEVAVQKAKDLFTVNKNENMTWISKIKQIISLVQDYCQAVFMATEHIQKVWGVVPDVEHMVDRMYEYLYEIYPPLFPAMLNRIDGMAAAEIEAYFARLEADQGTGEQQLAKVGGTGGAAGRQ
ncbi:MAG: glycoside hydrolase [Bacillota bacterium]